MRLSETQIQAIHTTADELFGRNARVSLFGSRVDDHQRGGDIDLLIEVDQVLNNRPAMAARFSARLQRRIGEQRIDVLIIDPNTRLQPIHSIARETGVTL
jgi:predicted nucleotidyltransferase